MSRMENRYNLKGNIRDVKNKKVALQFYTGDICDVVYI